MRASNKLVREWLLSNGYDEIWFKPHTKRNDVVFTQNGKYIATDLWNLFDGLCFKNGDLRCLQMKTNSWAKEKPITDFIRKHPLIVLSFNVTDKLKESKGKYKVFVREYRNQPSQRLMVEMNNI